MASALKTLQQSNLRKHKDLADKAHKAISQAMDLEQQKGDMGKILWLYLDGIDSIKLALQVSFNNPQEKEQVSKLNADMKSNLKKVEEHVRDLEKKYKNIRSSNLPPIIPSNQATTLRSCTPNSTSIRASSGRTLNIKPSNKISSRPNSSNRPSSASRPKSASRREDEMSHTILDQVLVEKPNVL